MEPKPAKRSKSRAAMCVRTAGNFGDVKKHHLFDSPSFSMAHFRKDLEKLSPKLIKLMDTIAMLDSQDQMLHGHLHKHMIFTDLSESKSIKVIASALAVRGFRPCFETKGSGFQLLADQELLAGHAPRGSNFGVLCSKPWSDRKMSAVFKRAVVTKFNERPANVHGDLIRIILLDQGYKEGIDLFDVKYVHLFDPLLPTDQRQVIGRSTRFCGQQGLKFLPNIGWPLHVFKYNTSLKTVDPALVQDAASIEDLWLRTLNLDTHQLNFAADLEAVIADAAVDRDLTRSVHTFEVQLNQIVPVAGGDATIHRKQPSRPEDSERTVTDPRRPGAPLLLGPPQSKKLLRLAGETEEDSERTVTDPRRPGAPLLLGPPQSKKLLRLAGETEEDSERTVTDPRRPGAPLLLGPPQSKKLLRLAGETEEEDSERTVMDPRRPGAPLQSKNQSRLASEMKDDSVRSDTRRPEPQSTSLPKPVPPLSVSRRPTTHSHVPEGSRMSLAKLRAHVLKTYGHFAYPPARMENQCQKKPRTDEANKEPGTTYTPTQEFIRHYFKPRMEHDIKGMLLYHSVGTGKTCTAIAAATTSFQPAGYTIIYVTRHTLKQDVWKNMVGKVMCHEGLKRRIARGKASAPAKVKPSLPLAGNEWLPPLSYKQFTNMLMRRNNFYNMLVQRNGAQDPLRKTLVIIDEAHKLYAPRGTVSENERPDMQVLSKWLKDSYAMSGADSARLLLMSGTPYMNDAMELIKLLSLLQRPGEEFPHDFKDFQAAYLDATGRFTAAGRERFQEAIAGQISYLNRTRDGRLFANPVMHAVEVDMPRSEQDQKPCLNDELRTARAEAKKSAKAAQTMVKEIKQSYSTLHKRCLADVASRAKVHKAHLKERKAHAAEVKKAALARCQQLGQGKPKADCSARAHLDFKKALEALQKEPIGADAAGERKAAKARDDARAACDTMEGKARASCRAAATRAYTAALKALSPDQDKCKDIDNERAEKVAAVQVAAVTAQKRLGALKAELQEARTKLRSTVAGIRDRTAETIRLNRALKALLSDLRTARAKVRADFADKKITREQMETRLAHLDEGISKRMAELRVRLQGSAIRMAELRLAKQEIEERIKSKVKSDLTPYTYLVNKCLQQKGKKAKKSEVNRAVKAERSNTLKASEQATLSAFYHDRVAALFANKPDGHTLNKRTLLLIFHPDKVDAGTRGLYTSSRAVRAVADRLFATAQSELDSGKPLHRAAVEELCRAALV